MESGEIIQLRNNEEKENWKQACTSLWIEVFGDKEQFVEHYMDSTWKWNQVLLLPCYKPEHLQEKVFCKLESFSEKTEIISMLHMNPYVLNVKDEIVNVHYIVGVCTREELRGKGYMDILLKKALFILKEQQEPFAYLMPADVEIYLPYQFVPAGFVEKKIYSVFRQGQGLQTAATLVIPFQNLSTEDRHKVIRLAKGRRGDVYVQLTEEYLLELEAQTHTYDGELITAWQSGEPLGLAAYLYEEGETPIEVIQFLAADGCAAGVRDTFHMYMCEHFQVEQIRIQYDDMYIISKGNDTDRGELYAAYTAQRQCTTMIRCLDPVWFLRRLPPQADWGKRCNVAVKDNILENNNRVFQIIFEKDGQKNEVIPCQDKPDHYLDVESLVEYVMRGMTIYTPELI